MSVLLLIVVLTVLTALILRLVASMGTGVEIEDWGSALGVALVITIAGWLSRAVFGPLPTGPWLIMAFGLFLFNTAIFAVATFTLPGVRTTTLGAVLAGAVLTAVDFAGPFLFSRLAPDVYNFLTSPRVIVGVSSLNF